ncbi:MAG: hypothetical protein AAB368_16015 [bacterium]
MGFIGGTALGWFSGRDLARSCRVSSAQPAARAALGLARRLGLLGAGLYLSLALGGFAWAGMAAGYLAAFGGRVGREALPHGR